MNKVYLAVAILGTALATPAIAEEQAAEAPKEEKKICRSEKMTGSLTRTTRVCLTAAQWRELTTRTKKGVDELQGSASGGQQIVSNPGPGGM